MQCTDPGSVTTVLHWHRSHASPRKRAEGLLSALALGYRGPHARLCLYLCFNPCTSAFPAGMHALESWSMIWPSYEKACLHHVTMHLHPNLSAAFSSGFPALTSSDTQLCYLVVSIMFTAAAAPLQS